MKLLYFVFIFFLFSSCTWDVETVHITGNTPLSAGNSKVWIVSHLFKKNRDYIPPDMKDRDLIVFYQSGNCKIIKWKNFCSEKGDYFRYSLQRYSDKKPVLTLKRKNKTWVFFLDKLSNDEVIMSPQPGTKFDYKMSIIPLPEW